MYTEAVASICRGHLTCKWGSGDGQLQPIVSVARTLLIELQNRFQSETYSAVL